MRMQGCGNTECVSRCRHYGEHDAYAECCSGTCSQGKYGPCKPVEPDAGKMVPEAEVRLRQRIAYEIGIRDAYHTLPAKWSDEGICEQGKIRYPDPEDKPDTSGPGCTCHYLGGGNVSQWTNPDCPIHPKEPEAPEWEFCKATFGYPPSGTGWEPLGPTWNGERVIVVWKRRKP